MVFGGIAVTAVSVYQIGPEALRLPLMALAAMLAGMAWVTIPALLKMKFAVNEIISTLLLNYVATYFLFICSMGRGGIRATPFPIRLNTRRRAAARSRLRGECGAAAGARLRADPVVADGIQPVRLLSEIHLRQSGDGTAGRRSHGEGRVVGRADLRRDLPALAGFVIPSATAGRLTLGFYEGYGFSGVLIAFLARTNPVYAAIVAVLIGMLFVTGQSLQIFYQIPFAMVQMIQAIIVMCVAASDFFIRHRIHLQR